MKPIENTISFLIADTHDRKIKELNELLDDMVVPSGKNIKALIRWLSKIYDADILEKMLFKERITKDNLTVLYLSILINSKRLDIDTLLKEDSTFTLTAYAANIASQIGKNRTTIYHHIKNALFTYEHVPSFRKKFDFFITLIRDNHG